jgi:hypothetical protein
LLAPAIARAEYVIQPAYLEISVPKDKLFQMTTLRVVNRGDKSIRLKGVMQSWSLDAGGGLELRSAEEKDSTVHWFRFNPREFEVPPRQSQLVRLAVSIPPGTAEGEYHSMILFEDLQTQTQRFAISQGANASIEVRQRTGAAVYAYYGEAKTEPHVGELQTRSELGKLFTDFVIDNSGKRHARLKGTLILYKREQNDNLLPIKECPVHESKDLLILSGGKLNVSQLLLDGEPAASTLQPGRYLLELTLTSPREPGVEPIKVTKELSF